MLNQELLQQLSKASQQAAEGQTTSALGKNSSQATEHLWRIAETSDTDRLESCLVSGADVNAANPRGVTALMRAVSRGNVKMVRALLAHGADPNSSRNDHFTPLLLAAFYGHEEIVRLLVEAGADINAHSRFETSAQMWASARTFRNVVEYLQKPLKNAEPEPIASQHDHSLQRVRLDIPVQNELVESNERLKFLDAQPDDSDVVMPELPFKSQPASWVPSSSHRFLVFAPAALILVLVVAGFIVTLKHRSRETSRVSATPGLNAATAVNVPAITTTTRTDNSASADEPPTRMPAEIASSKPSESKDESNHLNNTPKPRVVKSGFAVRDVQSFPAPSTQATAANESPQAAPPISEPPTKRESPAELKPADNGPASRQTVQAKGPAPSTPQLLTPASNTPSKARVIRWP